MTKIYQPCCFCCTCGAKTIGHAFQEMWGIAKGIGMISSTATKGNTRKKKANCKSYLKENLWYHNCNRKKKCTADFGDIDKGCCCSRCRSGKYVIGHKALNWIWMLMHMLWFVTNSIKCLLQNFLMLIFFGGNHYQRFRVERKVEILIFANQICEHEKLCDFRSKCFCRSQ